MKIPLTDKSVASIIFLAVYAGFLLLWLTLTGVAAEAQTSEPTYDSAYDDVPQDAWYRESVASLEEKGIFEGTDCEEGFCPGEPLKRWQMAVWLVRILDGQDPGQITESRFADVDDYEDWMHFIDRLSDLGVTVGCKSEPLRYCPDRAVSRSQMAAFLYRAFDLPDAESPAGFTDVSEESWAFNYINALAASKITVGCKSKPFSYCPGGSVTKAQMATFLYRALQWRAEQAAESDDGQSADGTGQTGGESDVFHTQRNALSVHMKEEIVDKYVADNPWLLEAWNYTNRESFEYRITGGLRHISRFPREEKDADGDLTKMVADVLGIPERCIKNPYCQRALVHEMAHVYTLANGAADRPGPLGIGHLYFDHFDEAGPGCPSTEFYAEVAQLLVPTQWNDITPDFARCGLTMDPSVLAEAEAVVGSVFSGEMPQWFYDTFQRADGSLDYVGIWAAVQNLPTGGRLRGIVVYQLKDQFGGYCSRRAASQSAFGYGDAADLGQPWRDGGCSAQLD